MFTRAKVRTLADYAAQLSGDHFGISIGSDLGHGTRYFSKTADKVWFGTRGARQAASYFLGVVEALNPGRTIADLPQDVRRVKLELIKIGGFSERWYARGIEDAHHYERKKTAS